MSNAVVVDDANSRIFYSGSWQVTNDTSVDPNGTAHGVVGSGSTVTGNATFAFTGTAITVFGVISPVDFSPNSSAPVATFNVDGMYAAQFIPQRPTTIVRQLIYGVFNLEDREHTLFMSISALNSALWIDYFEYAPTTGTVSASTITPTLTLSSSTITTISSTTTTTLTTTMQGLTQSSLTSNSLLSTNTTIHTMTGAADNWSMSTSTPGKSNTLSTGTIVGAAVGGACIFLAILAAVLFYLCRRRKKIVHTRDLSSPSQMDFWSRPLSTPLMTPFTLSESPTRATMAPHTPTAVSNAGFYLHRNQTSGLRHGTQDNTLKGHPIPATSKANLINTSSHFESISYGLGDAKERSHTRGSRPRIYSPHDLALRLPPPPPPPPPQLPPTSNSYYDWLEEELPPSYRPYTLE